MIRLQKRREKVFKAKEEKRNEAEVKRHGDVVDKYDASTTKEKEAVTFSGFKKTNSLEYAFQNSWQLAWQIVCSQ